MDESRAWLSALLSEVFSSDSIQAICTSIMSKKFPRTDKHRDEIVQMEEGRTRNQQQDVGSLEGETLVSTSMTLSLLVPH